MDTMRHPDVRPLTTAIGAVIGDIDLCKPLSGDTVAFLRRAMLDRGVIFIRGQDFTNAQMEMFASHFGTPIPEPFTSKPAEQAPRVISGDILAGKHAAAVWHSDTSYVPEPPMATVLRAVHLPPVGGDTCWASMYAAYDALSKPMRTMLDGLTAVHSMIPVVNRMGPEMARGFLDNAKVRDTECVHPVVRVHPETGRKALFVNEGWTTSIVELYPAESARVLALLFEHVKSPEFCVRWSWQPNDVALWDNRSTQHFAVPDYNTSRVTQRVVIAGDRPQGPVRHEEHKVAEFQ